MLKAYYASVTVLESSPCVDDVTVDRLVRETVAPMALHLRVSACETLASLLKRSRAACDTYAAPKLPPTLADDLLSAVLLLGSPPFSRHVLVKATLDLLRALCKSEVAHACESTLTHACQLIRLADAYIDVPYVAADTLWLLRVALERSTTLHSDLLAKVGDAFNSSRICQQARERICSAASPSSLDACVDVSPLGTRDLASVARRYLACSVQLVCTSRNAIALDSILWQHSKGNLMDVNAIVCTLVDQDTTLLNTLVTLVSLERSAGGEPAYTQQSIFEALCKHAVGNDHSVLLDWLVSEETVHSCASLLLSFRAVRVARASPHRALVEHLHAAIARLHRRQLFPFNPSPLLRRLSALLGD